MERGQIIAVDGKIYEYDRYDEHIKIHIVTEIDIDTEGFLTETYIPYAFGNEEFEKGYNKINLTEKQWYGVVAHFIRHNHDLTEEEAIDATEDIVGRCFIINMPKFDEVEAYIDCYLNR